MTNEEAIKELREMRFDPWTDNQQMEALDMASKALENICYLTDRPCDVCKFHTKYGCSQWACVFCNGLFGDMRGKDSKAESEDKA